LTDLVRWLRDALAGQAGLQAALLTGSALDREMLTRFSDIDLVLLVDDDADEKWAALALRLRRFLSTLSINVAQPARLPQLAPLLTCRLLCEQLPVIGRVDESLLGRPSSANLCAEGRHRANSSASYGRPQYRRAAAACLRRIASSLYSPDLSA
jgi:hypothetical protein